MVINKILLLDCSVLQKKKRGKWAHSTQRWGCKREHTKPNRVYLVPTPYHVKSPVLHRHSVLLRFYPHVQWYKKIEGFECSIFCKPKTKPLDIMISNYLIAFFQMMNGLRKFEVKYSGDPELQPICSFENPALVRLFYKFSTHLNEKVVL